MAVCLCAAALAGCGKNKVKKDENGDPIDTVIKIGVFSALTGEDGDWGKKEALGAEFANTLVNTLETGDIAYTIELRYGDNASSAGTASAAANGLVTEGCDVVIGTNTADISLAAADVFGGAGLAVIGTPKLDPSAVESSDSVYSISCLGPFEGAVTAAYAAGHYGTTAYILMKNGNTASAALGESFKNAFTAGGGAVREGGYQDGTTDFSDYFDAAVQAGAAMIFAPIPVEDTGLFLAQASEQGVALPILAGSGWNNSEVLEAARGTSLDISVPAGFDERIDTEAGAGFVTAFKQWLNDKPEKLADNGGDDAVSPASAIGYDAYMAAVEAIKKAGGAKPADIIAAFGGTTYDGVSGTITLDASGSMVCNGACILHADTSGGSWSYVTYQKAG